MTLSLCGSPLSEVFFSPFSATCNHNEHSRAFTWRPLLRLLNWYHIIYLSYCHSFEGDVQIDIIFGDPIFKWVVATRRNSLKLSDVIKRHRTWSTVIHVMACCLTAPSHYLNQCWSVISKLPRRSSKGLIIRSLEDANKEITIEICIFKIVPRSTRDWWTNSKLIDAE